jgi:four helix bundle protein
MAQSYHDLLVWQKAIDLTLCIYKLTRSFPNSELYGLTSQMRRAIESVASNIAEGRGRLNPAEFRQFLGLAQGSLFELRTQLLVARKLGFASGESFKEADLLSEDVSKMLRTFIQRLTVPPRASRSAPQLSRVEIEANS